MRGNRPIKCLRSNVPISPAGKFIVSFIARQQNRWFSPLLHLAGAASCAVLVAIFYALVFQPLEQKARAQEARLELLDQLLLTSGAESIEYRDLRNQFEEMTNSVAEIHRQLAEQKTETAVIGEINNLASQAGLRVLDYQVGLAEGHPSHSKAEVEFRCLGSYASICHFLDKAEQLTKTTKLSKFELDSSENSTEYPVQLGFVLYSNGNSNDTSER